MHSTQRHPGDDASPTFWAGRKVDETHKALLWQCLNDDPPCPSRLVLHALAETQVQISVTLRQINRLRKAWGLYRGKGRTRRAVSHKTIWVAGFAGLALPTSVVRRSDFDGPLTRLLV